MTHVQHAFKKASHELAAARENLEAARERVKKAERDFDRWAEAQDKEIPRHARSSNGVKIR